MPDDTYMTAGEVAAVLGGVNPKTVTRWANEGKLAHVRTLGGHRRYRRADVEAYMRASAVPGQPSTDTEGYPA